MKTIPCFVLLVLLYCLPAHAQKKCYPVPDSLGKTLAAVFLNKEDISKMPIFPTVKEMDMINQLEGAIGSPIAVEATAVEATAADNSAPFNQISEAWYKLLDLAQTKHISAATASYAKTYFTERAIEIGTEKTTHYEVYVVFKQAAQNIAVKFDVLWHKNKWLLINVDYDFYAYTGKGGNQNPFRSKGWSNQDQLTGSKPKFSAPVSKDKQGWTVRGICLAEPTPFINQVLQDLAKQQPASDFSNLLSAADFKKEYQPDLETMVNQVAKNVKSMSAAEQKELKAMQYAFKNNPAALYKDHVIQPITSLSTYLHTVDFNTKNVQSISYTISNFNYEVWSAGKILLKADVTLKTKDAEEGIQFMAAWRNDHWEIIYMQPSTYGISRAE